MRGFAGGDGCEELRELRILRSEAVGDTRVRGGPLRGPQGSERLGRIGRDGGRSDRRRGS